MTPVPLFAGLSAAPGPCCAIVICRGMRDERPSDAGLMVSVTTAKVVSMDTLFGDGGDGHDAVGGVAPTGEESAALTKSRCDHVVQVHSAFRRWRGALAGPGTSEVRVHAARVVLKEARAVLWLFRGEWPDDGAAAWGERLRAMMKALAPSRDLLIVRAVIAAEGRGLPRSEDRTAVRRALPRLEKPKPGALRSVGPLLKEFEQDLGAIAAQFPWAPLDDALAKALRRVRRLQAKAGRDDTPELWHRWRRRVKALAYQAEFVRPPDRPDWESLRGEAWHLQSILGGLQDVHITIDHLATLALPEKVRSTLRRRLRRHARKLQREAWRARIDKSKLRA